MFLAVFLGLIPAFIAKSKGRSFFLWYVYGVALFIVALIHSIIIKKNDNAFVGEGMVKCPYCAEFVKKEAKVCRYCNRDLPSPTEQLIAINQEPVITGSVCQYCKKPVSPNDERCPNCSGRL